MVVDCGGHGREKRTEARSFRRSWRWLSLRLFFRQNNVGLLLASSLSPPHASSCLLALFLLPDIWGLSDCCILLSILLT